VRESEEDTVKLDLNLGQIKKKEPLPSQSSGSSVFKAPTEPKKPKKEKESTLGKRKKSALEEIMEEEERRKARRRENEGKEGKVSKSSMSVSSSSSSTSSSSNKHLKDYWLKRDIVVKVVTKALGEKYYKKKAKVKEVVDKYAAIVVMLDSGAKVKLDQEHLETVVPTLGRPVLVLNGPHRGEEVKLTSLDIDNFCAEVKLNIDGYTVRLPYEHFSKIHKEWLN